MWQKNVDFLIFTIQGQKITFTFNKSNYRDTNAFKSIEMITRRTNNNNTLIKIRWNKEDGMTYNNFIIACKRE